MWYLVSILSFVGSDWPDVSRNLQKAQIKWARFSHFWGRYGYDTRTSGRFYVSVVHSVMLFGSDSWFITPRILWAFGGLYSQVERWISVRMPWCQNVHF